MKGSHVGRYLVRGNRSMIELAGGPDLPIASADSSASLIHWLSGLSTLSP